MFNITFDIKTFIMFIMLSITGLMILITADILDKNLLSKLLKKEKTFKVKFIST